MHPQKYLFSFRTQPHKYSFRQPLAKGERSAGNEGGKGGGGAFIVKGNALASIGDGVGYMCMYTYMFKPLGPSPLTTNCRNGPPSL